MFFFAYDAYADDRLFLKMESGCPGFFTDRELARGRGIVATSSDDNEAALTSIFAPALVSPRGQLDHLDLERLSVADIASVFGPAYAQDSRNPSLRLAPPMLLMLDRIVSIFAEGGRWGLGGAVAEKVLDADEWYFRCHFKDDPVLAGSLIVEGCVQLLQTYMLYVGLHAQTHAARFEPIPDLEQSVRCRGEVGPGVKQLTYRLHVRKVGLRPRPLAIAHVDILIGERVIVEVRDLGLQLNDPPLYGPRELSAFASGSITECFGPDFAAYEGRRIPRTPNGPLPLISRVIHIDGHRGDLTSGRIVTEFDVPSQPWFDTPEMDPGASPYAILMELALQPCGFLSAYVGSTMAFVDTDFRFRNLDGTGFLHTRPDLRGKTIRNEVHLLGTTALEGAILQRFSYSLSMDGEALFTGDAEFGYFTDAVLAEQIGLDGGRDVLPWYASAPQVSSVTAQHHAFERNRDAAFDLLDEVVCVPRGGSASLGYVYARATVDPTSWYFDAHFYQDPVMPGSFGVEAILQAIWYAAIDLDLVRDFRSPRYTPLTDHRTVWKYRGQIDPSDRLMQLEVHLTRVTREPNRLVLVGDAWLWNGARRIYACRDVAIAVVDGAAG